MHTALQVPMMFVVGSEAARSINRDADLRRGVDYGKDGMKRRAGNGGETRGERYTSGSNKVVRTVRAAAPEIRDQVGGER